MFKELPLFEILFSELL